jgi:flagellar M-ring protein FliF
MAEQTERPSTTDAATPAPVTGPAPRGETARRALPWALALVALGLAAALWLVGSARVEARSRGDSGDAHRSAREREIARMIATLGDVRSATVLIGNSAAGHGGASVTLELRDRSALSAETASAVAGLVASAVPGLAPEDVVVVDSRDAARTYRLSGDTGAAGDGGAVLRLRREVERALADKLRALFAGMHIDCVAVVSAEIDLDRVKKHIVDVDPQRTGGVVLKDERGYLAPDEAAATAAPRRGASAGRAAALPGAASRRRDETRKTEFDVSRLTQEVTKAVGRVAKVRASVVYFDRRTQSADGKWSYDTTVGSEENRLKYTRLAVRALGLEDYDEKSVEVQYMKSASAAPSVEEARRWPDVVGWAIGIGAAALAVAALAGAAVAVARMRTRRTLPATEAQPAATEAGPEVPASEKLRRDVTRTVAEDVGRAAGILRRWIAREG